MKADKYIVYTTLVLVLFGSLMIYSASSIWSEYKFDNKFYYLTRQLLFAGIGFILMFIISNIDFKIYKNNSTKLFLLCLFMLVLVLVPGIGVVRGGAQSWIGIGQFSVQPSEFMKFGLIVIISKYLSDNYKDMGQIKNFVYIMVLILIIFGIIMLQPDFGSATVILLGCFCILFVSGILYRWIAYFSVAGSIGAVLMIITAPYRLERILSFLDPWKDPLGSGFQIIQSLYAIAPGRIFGLGLFNSKQKYYYLPEPQTDFIFAIIAEELGLIGALALIMVFIFLIYRIFLVAVKSKDLFSQFLSLGVGSILFIQFFINIGVVIGLMPVTGITLPLISYGGSSLTITLMMIGVVLNISSKLE